MKTEYVVAANKPDGTQVFWTYTGFSQSLRRAARLISIDFASVTADMEQKTHPDWQLMIRVHERTQPVSVR